jgi:hypothetical protein
LCPRPVLAKLAFDAVTVKPTGRATAAPRVHSRYCSRPAAGRRPAKERQPFSFFQFPGHKTTSCQDRLGTNERNVKEKDLFFRTATRLPLVAGHRSLSVQEPISGHRAIDSLKCCKCFPATVWSVAWQKPHSLREPKPTDHSGPLLCVPERDGTAAVGAVAPRRLEVSAQNTGVVGKNFAVCPYNARMCGQKTLLRFPPLS